MRNYLGAGAGLVWALLSSSPYAYAENHHHHTTADTQNGLSISGFIIFENGISNQHDDAGRRNYVYSNDTEVHVTYQNQLDNGMKYGTVIELEADVTADAKNEGLNADKTYLFFESNAGRLELGNNSDAAHMLGINAATLARGAGGIHSNWFLYTNFPGSTGGVHDHGSFIHMPALPLHHMHGISEDASKITYFTPNFSGFQMGVSFIPDSGDGGQTFSGQVGHREFDNVLNGGIQYNNQVGNFSYQASLTGEIGEEEVQGHSDLQAYEAGLLLAYNDFSVAGSYGDWGHSVTHPSADNGKGEYWDVGAAYAFGRTGVSVTYLNSEYQHNTLQNLAFDIDYSLAPGLTPYAEINFFDADAADPTVTDNRGNIVMIGTELQF